MKHLGLSSVGLEEFFQLLIALVIGAIMGAEREYRTKSAGFRTVILITLGSTLFTIISFIVSNDARIAANIVTGIGFLGAGAIFKEGVNVKGLTTATTIWISAAIGMAIGIKEYEFAFAALIIVMIVLLGFSWLTSVISIINSEQIYRIHINSINPDQIEVLKQLIKNCGGSCNCTHQRKINNEMHLTFSIKGSKQSHKDIVILLYKSDIVSTFEV